VFVLYFRIEVDLEVVWAFYLYIFWVVWSGSDFWRRCRSVAIAVSSGSRRFL